MGLTKAVLQARLLCFCTDGASNLHGCVKGALQLISTRIERNDLVVFHCMNHKLELAVHGAVSGVTMVSHFRMFMDSLLLLCTLSGTLQETSSSVRGFRLWHEKDRQNIRRTLAFVFVPDCGCCIHILARYCFTSRSLQRPRQHLRTGQLHTAWQRRCRLGQFCSWDCINDIHPMILDALKSLSLFLQCRSASVIDAKEKLECTMRAIKAMKTVDGSWCHAVGSQETDWHWRTV